MTTLALCGEASQTDRYKRFLYRLQAACKELAQAHSPEETANWTDEFEYRVVSVEETLFINAITLESNLLTVIDESLSELQEANAKECKELASMLCEAIRDAKSKHFQQPKMNVTLGVNR